MSELFATGIAVLFIVIVIVIPAILIIVVASQSNMVKNARYKNQPTVLYSNPLLNNLLRRAQAAPQPLIIKLFIDRIDVGSESYSFAACGVPALHAKDLIIVAYWYCQCLAGKAKYEIRYIYGEQTAFYQPHVTMLGYTVYPVSMVSTN